MKEQVPFSERVITRGIQITGYSSILFVVLILYFLLSEGAPALLEAPLKSLAGIRWYPIESYFGLIPLILGSLIVTLGAAVIAIPFGVGTAIFISEIAPQWLKEILKPLVEILAGLPSVMLGFPGNPDHFSIIKTIIGSSNRIDRPDRFPSPGRHCHPDHRIDRRRCVEHCSQGIPGSQLGDWRHPVADDLGSHTPCRPVRCINCCYPGCRPVDW